MKGKSYIILGALSLMLAFSTAHAQSVAAKANIPFAFAAAESVFPAGEYRIKTLGPEQGSTLLITGEGRNAFILPIEKRSATESAQPKPVFNRYGGRYFLSEIWLTGQGVICKVHQSDLELRLAGMPVNRRQVASVTEKNTDDR